MAGGVTSKAAAFPVPIRLRLRLQSHLARIRREEAIRLQRQQIRAVGFDRVGERAIQQTHGGQPRHYGGSCGGWNLVRLKRERQAPREKDRNEANGWLHAFFWSI